MRKLLKITTTFALALVFTAGMAFGQNKADVSQTGNGNDGTIEQVGANLEGETEQEGNNNEAVTDQTGLRNEGDIQQIGFRNESSLSQEGEDNEASSTQGWTDDRVAKDNVSQISQSGGDNFVSSIQFYGSSNESDVIQNGGQNTAFVMQGWFSSDISAYDVVDGNSAEINQNSSYNDGRIFQYNGDDNIATIEQDIGNGNNGQISQGYLWNGIEADVGGVTNASVANNNQGHIEQLGDQNNSTVMQLGNNNSFDLTQNGTGNTVGEEGAVQSGALWFKQRGDGNEFAGVAKNSNNDLSLTPNRAAEQFNGATLDPSSEGISGYYGSFQRGDDNQIGLRQGNNDTGQIQQLGDNNTSLLFQGGAPSHDGTILQNGNNNTASISQTD